MYVYIYIYPLAFGLPATVPRTTDFTAHRQVVRKNTPF